MGTLDKMKDEAKDLVGEHGDQAKEGMDKGGEFADEKTGGKYSEKIDEGVDRGQEAIDDMRNR